MVNAGSFQQHPVLQTSKDVLKRMGSIRGGQLVDSLVLRLFLSLFPLILIGIAVLGFIAAGRQGGAGSLADQISGNLKLKGEMSDLLRELVANAESKRGTATAVGLIGALFSALSVVGAIAAMCNAAWQVSSRGLLDRLVGLGWLIGAVIVSAVVGAATAIVKLIDIPFFNTFVSFVASVASVAALFWWTQVALTNLRIPLRAYVPGAIVGAIGASLFQIFGAVIVERILASASGGAAPIAAIVAFLTFFSIFGRLFLLSVVVNVVKWERKHGTAQLMISAPMVQGSQWVETQRGGQRAKRKFSGPNRLQRVLRRP